MIWTELQATAALVRRILDDEYATSNTRRSAWVETYGCQQNEADADRLRGMLQEMGFDAATSREASDLVLLHTCAVREGAEQRVLGNLGSLKPLKQKNPNLIVCITGCMMQQPHRVEEVQKKHTHVDVILGTHTMHLLPQALAQVIEGSGRITYISQEAEGLAEGLPVQRASRIAAWVTVMHGCDNYCSYCIVPYTRGREMSRTPSVVVQEVAELVRQGYRSITLLGQNVNSYGKGLQQSMDFPTLLEQLDEVAEGCTLRFMTSHPKDAGVRLFEVMARGTNIAKHLHLPVQSGSDRILQRMNRRYTAEHYVNLIDQARTLMPDLTVTSDVMVGFPAESDADFAATLALVERVRFDSLFTFAYSRRSGTPASDMEDQVDESVKQERLSRLMKVQESISLSAHRALEGKTLKVLVEDVGRDGLLKSRTEGGILCFFPGDDSCVGQFEDVRITEGKTFVLYGCRE